MEQEPQKRGVDDTGSDAPFLCTNKCGFFGSPVMNDLCSKCYKDYLLKLARASSSAVAVEKRAYDDDKILPSEGLVVDVQEAKLGQVDGGTTSENPKNRPPNQCSFCKKRVGLTGFKCCCGETFCSLHRYSDEHNCMFNYMSAGQDAIAKANPVVKASKVEKI